MMTMMTTTMMMTSNKGGMMYVVYCMHSTARYHPVKGFRVLGWVYRLKYVVYIHTLANTKFPNSQIPKSKIDN